MEQKIKSIDIIQCLGFGINPDCEGLINEGNGYLGTLHTVIKSTMTGEAKEWKIQGYICKQCAIAAGYEVVNNKENDKHKS